MTIDREKIELSEYRIEKAFERLKASQTLLASYPFSTGILSKADGCRNI